jgi:hypothetical protein
MSDVIHCFALKIKISNVSVLSIELWKFWDVKLKATNQTKNISINDIIISPAKGDHIKLLPLSDVLCLLSKDARFVYKFLRVEVKLFVRVGLANSDLRINTVVFAITIQVESRDSVLQIQMRVPKSNLELGQQGWMRLASGSLGSSGLMDFVSENDWNHLKILRIPPIHNLKAQDSLSQFESNRLRQLIILSNTQLKQVIGFGTIHQTCLFVYWNQSILLCLLFNFISKLH